MQTILGFLTDTFGRIGAQFLSISFNDVIDIALLAVVLYYVYRFVRERRAGKLALGLGILVVLYALTTIFEMYAMSFLLQNVFQVGLLALIILFQPELRAALEKVGGDPLRSPEPDRAEGGCRGDPRHRQHLHRGQRHGARPHRCADRH